MKKVSLVSLVLIVIFLSGFQFPGRLRFINVEPYLYAPCTDNIRLAGKDQLEFRWRPNFPSQTRYYKFKLYKGIGTIESNLILQEKLDEPVRFFSLPAEKFSSGNSYSWSLTQVSFTGQKSEVASCSFEVK